MKSRGDRENQRGNSGELEPNKNEQKRSTKKNWEDPKKIENAKIFMIHNIRKECGIRQSQYLRGQMACSRSFFWEPLI